MMDFLSLLLSHQLALTAPQPTQLAARSAARLALVQESAPLAQMQASLRSQPGVIGDAITQIPTIGARATTASQPLAQVNASPEPAVSTSQASQESPLANFVKQLSSALFSGFNATSRGTLDDNSPGEIPRNTGSEAVITGVAELSTANPQPKDSSATESELAEFPVVEPIAEPAAEPIAESVVEPIAEPAAEPIAESVVEPVVEPVAESVVEPVMDVRSDLPQDRAGEDTKGNVESAEAIATPRPTAKSTAKVLPVSQSPVELPIESPLEPVEPPLEPVGPPRVSYDVLKYDLATTANLARLPQWEASDFEPHTGVQFHPDGSVTVRALVDNRYSRLTIVGDFNGWGEDETIDLAPYLLQPLPDDPAIHAVTLPPGHYHKMQYRLRDQYGNDRLHLSADVFSTPAFNQRFYDDRNEKHLNSVFWQPTEIEPDQLAPRPDFRGHSVVIAEVDMVTLSLKWHCNNPDSAFFNQTGAEHIANLYQFVGECGLPEQLADLGYNAIEFMPLDTHTDFWEPDAPYFPDWRYSYQSINFFGKHADFGSPDELKVMINHFHQAGLGVILDVVYGHFPNQANLPPRDFSRLGFTQYKLEDGSDLYSGSWTEWGTRRFRYDPAVRRYLVDAALIDILRYGFDGIRIDNVNGIDAQPNGRTLIRELSEQVQQYYPQAILIGEGYFGDWYLNHSLDVGGGGLTTTYSDEFYLWFTRNIITSRVEIDLWGLNKILNLDWPRTLLYYSGNHDEFANPGEYYQARGQYLVQAVNGGDFHNQKVRSWSALALFAGSYFLDMPQQWTLQGGNFGSNGAIDWDRLQAPATAPIVAFQSDMKRFYQAEPAFAPQNIHRYMVHWIDDVNKVVVFERVDFATDKRIYIAINLADQSISDYTLQIYPEGGTFRIALDTDRPKYGGQNRNPEYTEAWDHQVHFSLDSYGVVALAEQ